MSDARIHPSGTKVVATKWFTSSRSLGAGEGWEYSLPNDSVYDTSIKPGSGRLLVGRTLPLGWTVDNYGDQQVGPEQFIWQGNDSVIYSKNTVDTNGEWEYSKGVYELSRMRWSLTQNVQTCTREHTPSSRLTLQRSAQPFWSMPSREVPRDQSSRGMPVRWLSFAVSGTRRLSC